MWRSAIGCSLLVACQMPNPAFEDGRDSVADDSGSDDDIATSEAESESGTSNSSTDDAPDSSSDTNTTDPDATSDSTTDPDAATETTTDMTSDTGPDCMDGQLECDGGCVDASDPFNCGTCGMQCADNQICVNASCVPMKRVFATSVPFAANLSGIVAADQFCDLLAQNAGWDGEFKAWLSTPNSFPAQVFSKEGAYVRTDDVLVAKSWSDLIDMQLEAPISVDQTGAPLSSNETPCGGTTAIWTATTPEGLFAQGANCGNWTIATIGSSGRIGDAYAIDAKWTNIGDCFINCAAPLGLYCFQQ